MRVCVVGGGYVGLVTAACFAGCGYVVFCVETDQGRLASLRQGECPIYERGLSSLLRRGTRAGRLFFTKEMQDAVLGSTFILLTLPTPSTQAGHADLSLLLGAAEEIAQITARQRGRVRKIVINKSTAPVGTTQRIASIFRKRSTVRGARVTVVANPEFLREGSAVSDFMYPERIIVGTDSPDARAPLKRLYKPLLRENTSLIFTDCPSAELTKYACNAFLATKISFINEMARLCEQTGADIAEVRKGMAADARIGAAFLSAGMGYGGGCLPKDVQALVAMTREMDLTPRVMHAVQQTNQQQALVVFRMVKNHFKRLQKKVFAVWGLSFKPGTDDVRASPALANIDHLLQEGAILRAHDPAAMDAVRHTWDSRVRLCDTPYQAAEGADALLIMTDWPVYRRPNIDALNQTMRHKVIVDGRNLYTPQQARRWGYTYLSVGRAPVIATQSL